MSTELRSWIARLRFIRGEFPFLTEIGRIIRLRNSEGVLHHDSAPAYRSYTQITYYQNGQRHGIDADRFGSIACYYKGTLVPQKYILNPHGLTFDEIISHSNTEVRRIGCEIYGFERMLEEERFDVIDYDEETDAYLLKITLETADREDINLVKVVDGTHGFGPEKKEYFLQVPPNITTCKSAIAWTFYKEVQDYKPIIET